MTETRPWTVYALVALSAAGLIGALLLEPTLSVWDLITVAINALFVWGFWTGRSWAFSMSFMFASLCLAVTLTAAFVQVFLMEMGVTNGLLRAAAVSAVWVTLLLLPSTKRFAGLDRPPTPVST